MFDLLGLLVAVEKLEGPCPRLPYLGFQHDLEAVVIHLPLPKLVTYSSPGRINCCVQGRIWNPGQKAGSCQPSGAAREDFHEKDV